MRQLASFVESIEFFRLLEEAGIGVTEADNTTRVIINAEAGLPVKVTVQMLAPSGLVDVVSAFGVKAA